jgi:hypothetical protein
MLFAYILCLTIVKCRILVGDRVRGIPTHLLMFPAGEENSEKDSDSSGNAANLAPRPPLPPEGLPSENNAR